MSAHRARPALSEREGKLEIGPIPRFVKLFSRREAGGESDEDRTVSNPSTPSQRDDPRPQDISVVNSILPTQSLCTAALPPQIPMTWNAPAALARPYRAGRKNSTPAVPLLLAHCVLRTTSAATPRPAAKQAANRKSKIQEETPDSKSLHAVPNGDGPRPQDGRHSTPHPRSPARKSDKSRTQRA